MTLRPNGFASNGFYLQPLKQPRKDCWYQSKPIGHNPLSQVVKKLCDMARAKGYYTNHSLCRTCTTRLYQNGADEQQTMAITGHLSKDGVCTYKKISHDQEEKMNDMVIHPTKNPKMDSTNIQNVSCQESVSSKVKSLIV